MASPIIDATLLEKDVEYDGGVVKIRYHRITRIVRNSALEKAVIAYQKDNPGDTGYYPHVFERELVRSCLKWWDLPMGIELGWDLLDGESDVGDRIAEAIGVPAARASLMPRNKEVKDAKNSP